MIYLNHQSLTNGINFRKPHLKNEICWIMPLGTGSSRIAVDIPYEGRDTAFKVAINNKGIAQNIEEIALLNDYYIRDLEITIPVIDYDTSDKPKWIHMEKAQKTHFSKRNMVSL